MHLRYRIAAAAGGVLSAAALALAGTLPAAANIGGTQVITANGEAGEFANMNGPGHFTDLQAQGGANANLEGLGSTGGAGIQLCNESSGNAVQLGLRWNTTAHKFDVLVGSGTLTAGTGTNNTACDSGGAFTGGPLSMPLQIPAGDNYKLELKEISPGFYEAFAKDTTLGISSSKAFSGLSFPDTASVGVVQNQTNLSAPAVNRLCDFWSVLATGSAGGHASLGGSSFWTAQLAHSTANGLSSDPTLVTPVDVFFRHVHINIGSETGV